MLLEAVFTNREKCDKIVEKNKDGDEMMSENTGKQVYASNLTDKQWKEICVVNRCDPRKKRSNFKIWYNESITKL